MKRIILRVQTLTGRKGWWIVIGDLELPAPNQREACIEAAMIANWHADGGGHSEVIVHRRDGTIGPRNTYPRSSDPRRSQG